MFGQASRHGVGVSVVDVEALGLEFCGEVAHRSEDHVQPLAVPPLGTDLVGRLDQQYPVLAGRSLRERADAPIQLVAEYPDGAHPTSVHERCPAWRAQ